MSPLFTTGPGRFRAPVSRHRRPGANRLPSALGALVLLAVVVAVGGVIVDHRLTTDTRLAPFVAVGAAGERVSTGSLDVTVLQARPVAAIADRPGRRVTTGGVWLLVRVRAMAREEVATIGAAQVRDPQGRVWDTTRRITQPLAEGYYRLQPGVPVEGEIVFEVPAEVAASELTIRLGSSRREYLSTMAEIALPVDAAEFARAAADAAALADAEPGESDLEPVLLAVTEVVLPEPQIWRAGSGAGQ